MTEPTPARDEHAKTEVPSIAAANPTSWAIFALARSHKALAAQLIGNLGLYPGQELILMQLWDRDGRSQKELAQMQRLDHSTINKSVRRLEAAGLVTRRQSPTDGRVTQVFLTDAGRRLEAPTRSAWAELERRTNQGLTDAQQRDFLRHARLIAPHVEPDPT
jgi:DNA-binding MarR family transcriptional regulator